MYAHVTGGVVDSVGGTPPETALINGRWYDLRGRVAATLALAGWYVVTEATRPADTASNTSSVSYTFTGSAINQVWTVRAKTAQEIADATAAANTTTLTTDALADIDLLVTSVASLNVVIAKANNTISGADTKQVAQESRRIARALIRVLRLQLAQTSSTNVGA